MDKTNILKNIEEDTTAIIIALDDDVHEKLCYIAKAKKATIVQTVRAIIGRITNRYDVRVVKNEDD